MLADKIKQLNLVHEQLQEFTPTPGSLATAMYYTGMDLSGKPIRVARSHSDRLKARNLIQGSDKRGGTGQRDDVQRRDKAPHKLDNRRSGPPTIRSAERPGNKKR
jgi:radical SAM superfamily enzyme YgiQ (UPF0313 family)